MTNVTFWWTIMGWLEHEVISACHIHRWFRWIRRISSYSLEPKLCGSRCGWMSWGFIFPHSRTASSLGDSMFEELFTGWWNPMASGSKMIQVPPKKVLYPPNCTLSAFLAADPWIHREISLLNTRFVGCLPRFVANRMLSWPGTHPRGGLGWCVTRGLE